MTSDLEFLVQALAVPALVPLPTGVKEKKTDIHIKVTLGKTAPNFDESHTHPI